MKSLKFLSLALFFLLLLGFVGYNTQTINFKVFGNCNMCKNRIEKSLSDLDGIIKADWNMETKIMEVVFDDSKIETQEIHKAIAKVGHDNIDEDGILYKAEDKVYDALHSCCKYERPQLDLN